MKERNENLKVNEGIKEESSSKKGIIIGAIAAVIVIILVVVVIALITTKNSNKVTEKPIETPKVEVEVPVETEDPVEEIVKVEESTEEVPVEEPVEDPTANLSNEEWVKSLNVERPTFLVFNELTGERKALEDGAEYTLVEGDELGIEVPSRWLWQGENDIYLYVNTENKYSCIVYQLDYDMIGEKTEFTVTYNNRDGQPVPVTVYLSK